MTGLFFYLSAIAILTPAHNTPDGVIFRAVQVVVRSSAIQIRYQVGLHDNMIRRELQTLSPPEAVIPADAAEAIARYRDAIAPRLAQQMRVTIDGIPAALQVDRADIVRQPHCSLEFVYQIPFVPGTEPAKFILWDNNFQQVPGFHFAAMRARGNAAVLPIGGEKPLERLPSVPEPGETISVPLEPMRGLAAYVCLAGVEPPATPPATPAPTPMAAEIPRLTLDARAANEPRPAPASGDEPVPEATPVTNRTAGQVWWPLSWGAAAVLIAAAWWWTSRTAVKEHP